MTEPFDIEAARALCDAATPGPWHRIYDRVVTGDYDEEADPDDYATMQRRCTVAKTHPFEMRISRDPRHIADAEFIAAARSGWPAALDEIERLRGEVVAVWARHDEQEDRAEAAEAEVERLREALQAVRELCTVTGRLQGADPDTGDWDVSALALLAVLDKLPDGERPRRYDQCDGTCTTDCGHCKGAGRPESEEQR